MNRIANGNITRTALALWACASIASASTILKDGFETISGWEVWSPNASIASVNQQLVISARCTTPLDTNDFMKTHFPVVHGITVPTLTNNCTLEARTDLIGASETNAWADLHFLWNRNGGCGHMLLKDDNELYLLKWWNGGSAGAVFLEEFSPLKNTNVTLVLRLTRRDANLVMNVQVLDKENADAVLFERSATDTPQVDPVFLNVAIKTTTPDVAGEGWQFIGGAGYVELCLDWADPGHAPAAGLARMVYDNVEVKLYPSPRPNVIGWDSSPGNSVPADLTNAMAVAAGGLHALALRNNGTVLEWDELGKPYPNGLSNVVAIASYSTGCDIFQSDLHAMALRADGTVVDWVDRCNQRSQIAVPTGVTNVVAIAAGWGDSLALRADGTVVAWGGDWGGASALTNVPPGLGNVVAVAAGTSQALALRADGTVVAWGSQTTLPAGLTNVVAIADGLALRADGTVAAWDDSGQIVTNLPTGLTNVVALAAGPTHNLALRADGRVLTWDMNMFGCTNVPATLTNAIALAAGFGRNVALIGDGPPVVHASLRHPTMANNGFSVSVPTLSGRVYSLEYKNSLKDPDWIPLPLVAGTGHEVTLTDTSAAGGHRFYRVRRW